MANFWMSLCRRQLSAGDLLDLSGGHHGVFVLDGSVALNGRTFETGNGGYGAGGHLGTQDGAEVLHFGVTETPADNALLAEQFEWSGPDGVFRLDQVSFPPGARAYRHVHPGPGIRCLTQGALEIQSDHDRTVFRAGEAWFEGANAPVQATAVDEPTAFVRAMILPPQFLGQPTLRLLNEEDQDKPRLQTNSRFFDQAIVV